MRTKPPPEKTDDLDRISLWEIQNTASFVRTTVLNDDYTSSWVVPKQCVLGV